MVIQFGGFQELGGLKWLLFYLTLSIAHQLVGSVTAVLSVY